MSSGPFTLEPGEEQDFEFAFLYARGDSRFASLSRVLNLARYLNQDQSFFDPDISVDEPTVSTPTPDIAGFRPIYPNPANNSALIEYTVTETTHVRIVLYDILGRPLTEVVNRVQQPGWYSENVALNDLPSGTYI